MTTDKEPESMEEMMEQAAAAESTGQEPVAQSAAAPANTETARGAEEDAAKVNRPVEPRRRKKVPEQGTAAAPAGKAGTNRRVLQSIHH